MPPATNNGGRSTIVARFLPPLAVFLPALVIGTVLYVAGDTLGYDYHAYRAAAERALQGRPLYDAGVDVAGGFAIYLYPPPFALAFVPFALLPDAIGTWLWVGLLVIAFVAAIVAMPIPWIVRWAVLLVAGVSWPVAYSIKLGQVGPILLLLFALGWRYLDRPAPLGLSIAGGALIKVQPVVHVAWAVLTGRVRAATIAVAAGLVAALLATAVLGIGVWAEYVALLQRVGSSPITTPHNFTPGAIAYQQGLPEATASVVQLTVMALTLVVAVVAAIRAAPAASFVAFAVASQLWSPVLWDHYAMLLALPVAYLLSRGHWWAAAVLPAFWLPQPVLYPVLFGLCLVAPVLAGEPRERRDTGNQHAQVVKPQHG